MARSLPNIDNSATLKKKNREEFKSFVVNVVTDSFIYEHLPTSVSLYDEAETLFRVVLENKRFVYEQIAVDNIKDYIDVYLYGVKEPQDRYQVTGSYDDVVGNNIVINFVEDITRVPTAVVDEFEEGIETFVVKGKIVDVNLD